MNETTANQKPDAAAESVPETGAPAATPTPTEPSASGGPTGQADAAETKQAETKHAEEKHAEEKEVLAGEVVAGEEPAEEGPVAGESPAEPESAPQGASSAAASSADDRASPGPLAGELAALRAGLEERTSDLQRLSAEYANYRKRVERDRLLVAEQAIAQVVTALLPVLDDLDRAREHGDLVGPFATMADQLGAALAKFGLTGFGEVGDAFDPTRHEAVTHQTSTEVTVPTCVTVMRRGYLLGERLLRPALVAVADPESQ